MKRLLAGLLSLVLSLFLVAAVVLSWLLLTTSGARWLAEWALEQEPRLAFSIRDGALLSGLELAGLAWRDAGLIISAEAAEIAWTPDCLLAGRVCIDALRLQSPQLTVAASTAPPEPPQRPAPARLALPVVVRLDLLQISDARFDVPGARGELASLQASGGFADDTLSLDWARVQGLRVVLPPGAAPEEQALQAAEPAAPALPEVSLPFDLVIDGFLLENAELVAAERHWPIDSAALALTWRGTELALRNLQLDLPQLQAELEGKLRLQEDYPLALQLKAQLQPPELPRPLVVRAQLSGSVRELALEVSTQGAAAVTAAGRLQPLDPNLPFELRADWQALGWPLQGEPQYSLRHGELTAAGSLKGYSLNLDGRLAGSAVPAGRWQVQATGDLDGLRIQQLVVESLGGRVVGSGILGWTQGFNWHAQLKAQDIDPGRFWPDYPGRLGGVVSTEGQLLEEGVRLRVQTQGIEGRLRGYPLSLRGGVLRGPDGIWQLQRLRLASGDNRLLADGRIGERWDLQGSFELPQLSALAPELTGAAQGRFALGGPLATPDVTLSAGAEQLRYESYRVGTLRVDGQLARLGLAAGELTVQAAGLELGEQVLSELSARLTGTRGNHRLSLSAHGPQLGAELAFTGSLSENLDWRGRLLEAELAAPPQQRWRLAEPVALRWRQQAARLLVEAHCWLQEQARLCLTQPAGVGAEGELALALTDFRLQWLAAYLPEEVRWQGPLDASARLRWQPQTPLRLKLEAASKEGSVRLVQEQEDELVLRYQRLAADLALGPEGVAAEVTLESRELGEGRVVLRTDPGAQPRPLAGQVHLKGLRLDVLKPFLPQLQTLAGTVSAQGRLDGTLREPKFYGEVRLTQGQVASPVLPLELAGVQILAQVQGSEARLSGQYRTGEEGRGSLGGQAAWGGESWRLALNIQGEELLVSYPPVARLRVSPDLKLRIEPRQVAVSGRIRVPRGQITLEELPEGAVQVSEDVVVVRRPGQAPGEAEPEGPEPLPGWLVSMNVEVVLGDAVELSGRGLSGRLSGSLNLRQRPGGVPEAVGELRVEEGMYEAYGQELKIRQGQLIFSGPISEPDLNVEAVREAGDVVAGIRIEGRPDEPRATLFSEPGMPQEDILSYIIRGRALSDGGPSTSEQQLLTQAALSLGIFGGKGLATSLASELGIEDFELGTSGEGQETQFELSGYLNPDLFVRYGIGVFAPVNTLTLRYRLSDRFFVEAVSSLESAIDFLYEFRF